MKSLNEKHNFLKADVPCFWDICSEEPLIELIVQSKNEDLFLYKALATNLVPFGMESCEVVLEKLAALFDVEKLREVFKSYLEKSVEPIPYTTLNSMGYESKGTGTMYQNVLNKGFDYYFKNRGITNNKKGFTINHNILSRHMQSRMNLFTVQQEFVAYDFLMGKYVILPEKQLKSLAKKVVHEAVEDIWKVSDGNEIVEHLSLDVRCYESIEEDVKYINLENGLLYLPTMELVAHDPSVLTMVQLPINYNPNAQCPQFIEFLLDIFEGDQERVDLMQELMGYCLTVDTQLQKFFIFYGNGSNGKSLLADIIREVCGHENCSSSTLAQLGERFGAQTIFKKRVNISSEHESKAALNTQQLKLITGEDNILIEEKYHNPFSIKPYVKLIILLNNHMHVTDQSHGFFRRCVVIPFNKRYVDSNEVISDNESYKDKNLKSKLLSETEGIFIWALKGYQRLVQNGYNLSESTACNEALRNFYKKINPIKVFIDERLIKSPSEKTLKNAIFNEFQQWAAENYLDEFNEITSHMFWQQFKKNIPSWDEKNNCKSNGIRYIKGYKLAA